METKKFDSKEHLDKIRKMAAKKMPVSLQKMIDRKRELIESGEVHKLHVYFSKPNRKGAPHSVSTIPVHDCANCSKCALQCYDLRHDCNNATVRGTRARNSAILEADPERFFSEIDGFCKTVDKFRWHVGGDVTNLKYWIHVVDIAKNNPHCQFHIFTKNYDAVNNWIIINFERFEDIDAKEGRKFLPDNISLRFSLWPGLEVENPFQIPTAEVVFEDSFVPTKPDSAICTGNCTACAVYGRNCFDKTISTVYLPVH